MGVKPSYKSPRAFIESYPDNLRGELAHFISFFSFCIIGWDEVSAKEYQEKYCAYNPKTLAYHFKSKLTSEPFKVNLFVISSIHNNAEQWYTESIILIEEYIKKSQE